MRLQIDVEYDQIADQKVHNSNYKYSKQNYHQIDIKIRMDRFAEIFKELPKKLFFLILFNLFFGAIAFLKYEKLNALNNLNKKNR
jgi:hypothetical protein